MPKTRPPYAAAFRRQMVDLVRSGRTSEALAREFEPSAQAIRARWQAMTSPNVRSISPPWHWPNRPRTPGNPRPILS